MQNGVELMKNMQNRKGALLLSAAAAAGLIGVSRSKFFELDSAGRIPRAIRLGQRCPRWSLVELQSWIAAGAPDRHAWERLKAKSREKSATSG